MNSFHNNSSVAEELAKIKTISELNDRVQKDLEASKKHSDVEDRFETVVYGPPSMLLSYLFIRLGISPNTVTFLSLVFGVCGSLFFYPRHIVLNFIGIFIELIAVLLDCSDGQVARLTHNSSQLGRFLDGLVDTLNFSAIYIAIGFRMMREPIPFTHVRWQAFIWIVIVISGWCHAEEARLADYYRVLHMYFLNYKSTAYYTSAARIRKELEESKDTPFYNRLYLRMYLAYTSIQERMTPNMQKLLRAIEASGGNISEELSDAYTSRSRKYVQLTNTLTFNIRAFMLFGLILLRLHPFFFPFNIIVLGGLAIFMLAKYERIAKEVYESFFA